MTCGGCGGIEFRLFHHTEGVATQCRKCTALSVITVQPAEIKVDVLKFALEGAVTRRGVQMGSMDEEEEEELDKDIAELEKRLAKAKEAQ